jgi:hypothetical protein
MYYIIGCIIIIAIIIDCITRTKTAGQKVSSDSEEIETETAGADDNAKSAPQSLYYKSNLLTKSEWAFYKYKLKPLADKYNFHILSKVRMEDIVKPKDTLDKSAKASARGRVKSRHIDFVIANPDNLRIYLAIELDGKSHEKLDQQKADYFKDSVFEEIGLPFIRTNGKDDIEKELCEKLNISVKQ